MKANLALIIFIFSLNLFSQATNDYERRSEIDNKSPQDYCLEQFDRAEMSAWRHRNTILGAAHWVSRLGEWFSNMDWDYVLDKIRDEVRYECFKVETVIAAKCVEFLVDHMDKYEMASRGESVIKECIRLPQDLKTSSLKSCMSQICREEGSFYSLSYRCTRDEFSK